MLYAGTAAAARSFRARRVAQSARRPPPAPHRRYACPYGRRRLRMRSQRRDPALAADRVPSLEAPQRREARDVAATGDVGVLSLDRRRAPPHALADRSHLAREDPSMKTHLNLQTADLERSVTYY